MPTAVFIRHYNVTVWLGPAVDREFTVDQRLFSVGNASDNSNTVAALQYTPLFHLIPPYNDKYSPVWFSMVERRLST